ENAIAELKQGVKLAPQQSETHEALARVLSAHGDSQDARDEMRKAIDLVPSRPELHDALGSLLAQEKEYPEAEKEFRAALSLDGRYEPALLHLGVALLDSGKAEDAKQFLTQAAQVNPEDGFAHFYLGTILEAQHDLSGALGEYEVASKLAPNL